MKELSIILNAYRNLGDHPADAILATVVDVKGSAYRRPGARMLITPEGTRTGSVSGGCLEGDIIKRAWWWTESGGAMVRAYDTTADPDTVWELGLGCNGEVRVLLERLANTESSQQMLRFLTACVSGRRTGVMATTIASPEGSTIPVGARLFYDGQQYQGALLQTDLGAAVQPYAREALSLQTSCILSLNSENGPVEIFVEVIAPSLSLVIFGAGYDAVPLVRLAKEIGWHVTIADGRPAYAQQHRFPLADEIVLTQPDDLLKGVRLHSASAVVVMNHSYATDREILKQLLSYSVVYVGILGPRKRTEKMLAEIGVCHLPECFHAPIGLDIGADTPEGISLSIAAEIQAVVAGRQGGKLRHRQGPIYEQNVSGQTADALTVAA